METSARPSAALPPIGHMDSSALKREEAELQAAQTMVNINPQAGQTGIGLPSGPPPSYTYATSTAAAAAAIASAPTSATTGKTTDSHHSSSTEYDAHPSSASVKQSLPSIHEALSHRDEERHHAPPRSPDPRYGSYRRYSSPSPARFGRSYGHDPKRDPSASHRHSQYNANWHSPPSPRTYGPVGAVPRSQSPRITREPWPSGARASQPPHPSGPSLPPQRTRSPRETAQYGPPVQSPSFAGQHYVYSHHAPPATTYGPPPTQYAPAYSAAGGPSHYDVSRDAPPWPGDGEKHTGPKLDGRDSHSSLKHHRDGSDLDALLNEVHECSYNLMQFSETFRMRSHHTQRSGPISGSIPSVTDVHDAMRYSSRIQEGLDYVLKRVRAEEAERAAERLAREADAKRHARPERDETASARKAESTGEGGFANADTKKRRGRAAPPGRCHACNRAETPEWRRGPDGARTLCNACGLHYAKHARKMGAQKAALAGSNLRPKSAGGHG